MLCPCCGSKMAVTASECDCGARMVGAPLDDTPIRVRRFGPTMASVAILLGVAASSLIFTYWLAIGGALALIQSWRATKLAHRQRDLYGGYRTAISVFVITAATLLGLAAYGITRIPRVFEKQQMRLDAATQNAFFHWANLLQDYKARNGSFPDNIQAFKKELGEALPTDYWGKPIRYQSLSGAIAAANVNALSGRRGAILNFDNFEIRSAGPDGKMGTADDIVMRDGVIITSPDVVKQPILPDQFDR